MRNIILILLAAVLIFGCVSGPKAGAPNISSITANIPGAPPEACTQSQTFSALAPGILSETSELTATVACAGGQSIEVDVDGNPVTTKQVQTNDSQEVKLDIPATTDGSHTVTVQIGGQNVLSESWNVTPLGVQKIEGLETDAVTYKQWLAEAVDVGNQISVPRAEAVISTEQSSMQPKSTVVLEVRKDANGAPGDLVGSASDPMKTVTQSDNWITFDFSPALTLPPGRYWMVVKAVQGTTPSLVTDILQLHYVTVDKTAAGNDYTRQMALSVDENTGAATQSTWQPLPYDKEYDMFLTTSK